MFAVPLQDERVRVEPIIGNDGGPAHFFQEFFDDLSIPASNLIGDENDGWRVAHALLFHERNATAGVGHGLGLGGGAERERTSGPGVADLLAAAERNGTLADRAVHQLIAEAYIDEVALAEANRRVGVGMQAGVYKGDWGWLLKLGLAVHTLRRAEIALAVAGPLGVISEADGDESPDDNVGERWMKAKNISIAGGTNEMQRNIVSERLLDMPREPASDRDIPFVEVARRRPTR
jgi:alkylation response protein AidB-like acyl-CoA dehydrogenase